METPIKLINIKIEVKKYTNVQCILGVTNTSRYNSRANDINFRSGIGQCIR